MDNGVVKNWKVYFHENKINNKIYFGITSQNVNRRWENGKGYYESPRFWNAIKKYGWNNFSHEILAENLTENEAKNFEKALIKSFREQFGRDNLYNLTDGGDGVVGLKHSLEARKKMSKANKGEKNPSSKLSKENVIEIKHLLEKEELTQSEIGKLFNVARETIRDINTGKTWNHL